MKKTLSVFTTALFLFAGATSVLAGETSTKEVCTTNQYGETTCTKTTEGEEVVVHEPIDAAIGDINPVMLSMTLLVGSYVSYKASAKTK